MGDAEKFILGNRVGVAIEGFSRDHFIKGLNDFMTLLKEEDIKERCLVAARILSVDNGVKGFLGLYGSLGNKTPKSDENIIYCPISDIRSE